MKQYTINGITYKQVRKDMARKLYAQGKEIAMLQCKANPFSPWNVFVIMRLGDDFDKISNAYEYYNCNNELGKYTNFFTFQNR